MIRELPGFYKSNPQYQIEVIHPGGERHIVSVETIQEQYISVRWGMSGIYDIFLKSNTMVARSIKARRKGRCYWKVVDIEQVRQFVKEYFKPNKDEMQMSIEKHIESMPGKK